MKLDFSCRWRCLPFESVQINCLLKWTSKWKQHFFWVIYQNPESSQHMTHNFRGVVNKTYLEHRERTINRAQLSHTPCRNRKGEKGILKWLLYLGCGGKHTLNMIADLKCSSNSNRSDIWIKQLSGWAVTHSAIDRWLASWLALELLRGCTDGGAGCVFPERFD